MCVCVVCVCYVDTPIPSNKNLSCSFRKCPQIHLPVSLSFPLTHMHIPGLKPLYAKSSHSTLHLLLSPPALSHTTHIALIQNPFGHTKWTRFLLLFLISLSHSLTHSRTQQQQQQQQQHLQQHTSICLASLTGFLASLSAPLLSRNFTTSMRLFNTAMCIGVHPCRVKDIQ